MRGQRAMPRGTCKGSCTLKSTYVGTCSVGGGVASFAFCVRSFFTFRRYPPNPSTSTWCSCASQSTPLLLFGARFTGWSFCVRFYLSSNLPVGKSAATSRLSAPSDILRIDYARGPKEQHISVRWRREKYALEGMHHWQSEGSFEMHMEYRVPVSLFASR